MQGVERSIGELNFVWRTLAEHDPLGEGEIHLWGFSLDKIEDDIGRLRNLMSADEQLRAQKYHFATDRGRFIARRGMLRTIVSRYLSADPQAVKFQAGQHGKLHLTGEFAHSKLEFSLTHSQGRALLAVAWGQPMGVDLEYLRPLSDLEGLIEQCLTHSEKCVLESLPVACRSDYFYRCWTGKEACLKAIGTGLSHRFDSVSISWRIAEGVAEVQSDSGASETWLVRSFSPFDGYLAAIAYSHQPVRLECFAA